jgi:hypothetical protein
VNENLPPSSVARKRKLRRYVTGFALVFAAVFSIANSSQSGIQFATGANSSSSYGWPSPLLHTHTYTTHGFRGDHWEHESLFEGTEVASWSACCASLAACGSISAALVATPALAHRLFSSSPSHANDRNA